MSGCYPPMEWNQFGEMDDRTNNYFERYNNQMNIKLKIKPTLLKFCDYLINEENKMEICFLQSDKEPFYMKKQTKIVKDKDGHVTELHVEADFEKKNKPKGNLSWVSALNEKIPPKKVEVVNFEFFSRK